MAALLTSVIENSSKVSEYIISCRAMGIEILPPDINEGESGFSVSDGKIRYGLCAIKSIGKSVIDAIVQEREQNGKYTSLNDFAQRLSGKEVNKRTIENFIKAGAFDSLNPNRRQLMSVYVAVIDRVNEEKKKSISGQMSLFDLVPEEEKADYDIKYPNLPEYAKEEKLAFEKEVLGVYVSGHPLEEYEEKWRKNVKAFSKDFVVDEEGNTVVTDNDYTVIGGMVENITIKNTRTGKTMAFITIEDLYGTVEVLVFPNVLERYRYMIRNDAKLFIRGRVTVSGEEQAKLICDKIEEFDKVPSELWIQFLNKADYMQKEEALFGLLKSSDGSDKVVIYLREEKQKKVLPANMTVKADFALLERLYQAFGNDNVKVVEKSIEIR